MFMYEAAILGIVGSIIGGVLSIIAGYAISALALNTTKYLFVWSSATPIIEGICFGIVISLACGIYPARESSKPQPPIGDEA